MTKAPITSPFRAMEDEAYHAFREWPIFLILRQKELATHLATAHSAPPAPPPPPQDTLSAAAADGRPEPGKVKGR